jgi:trimeric autotransporter adhesin
MRYRLRGGLVCYLTSITMKTKASIIIVFLWVFQILIIHGTTQAVINYIHPVEFTQPFYYTSLSKYSNQTSALSGNDITESLSPLFLACAPDPPSEYISNVTIGTINQTSGYSATGYKDFTSQTISLQIGVNITATITVTNPKVTDQILIWVDWNKDGDFDDAGENVYSSSSSFNSPHITTSFTPPAGAAIGSTRMRIRLHDQACGPNATPCGNSSWGEVEDYTINVLCIPTAAPIIGNISPSTCTLATGSVVLNGLPATGSWTLTRTPGGTTTTGTGTSSTMTGLAAGTYTYTVTNISGCKSIASANIVINYQPVAAPTGTATQSFNSGSTIANLAATGSGIKWYAGSVCGGDLLPNTLLVNGSHYFASQTINSCESTGRFEVTVTVPPPPTMNVNGNVGANINMCYDATQTITVAGGTTTFVVQHGGSATTIAGQNILYLPGTNVQSGGHMWGYVAPNGPYCVNPSIPTLDTTKDEIPFSSGKSSFKIYPNPTTGSFILELQGDIPEEQISAEVYGMRGEKILSEILIHERKHEFSLYDKPAGVYFIRVITGNKSETAKIIRQ